MVFENELIQLIQYAPQTSEVEKTPLLFVPPCINKYYLLDLGAGNSLVEYAVAQGHRVFLISWRSAVPETAHLTWDDYLEMGPLKAVDVVLDITGAERTNALGLLCRRHDPELRRGRAGRATSRTSWRRRPLLTTMLDFSNSAGEIGLLIDAGSVALREATIGKGGILPGKELAFTFGTLRANDLIWRYVVDSYLKGATPDAFDLLYWDSDSVSLPGPMYCWYTRNTYLENNIKDPGKTTQCGVPVDFSKIDVPIYLLASREDHMGHGKRLFGQRIWSVVKRDLSLPRAGTSPVSSIRRLATNVATGSTRTSNSDPQSWFDAAEERAGSWWPDWDAWMRRHSNGTVSAPTAQGNENYPAIEPAPGRYVKLKSN